MTISEALIVAHDNLLAAGIKTARLDALVLLEHVSKKNRAWLLARPSANLAASVKLDYFRLIKKRTQRYPLAYLTGRQEFYGLNFKVTPSVLIPRPETESLVEFALNLSIEQANVLDIGTGCGAIAVAISSSRSAWQVHASDISNAALKVASANAKSNRTNIKFVRSNLFNNIVGKFDIITANLPYLPKPISTSAETKNEPASALFAGNDGLDVYRCFFTQVRNFLMPSGYVIIEADPKQHNSITAMAFAARLTQVKSADFLMAFTS